MTDISGVHAPLNPDGHRQLHAQTGHAEAGSGAGCPGGLEWCIWALPRAITGVFLAVLFAWIYQAEGGIGTDESSLFGLHAMFMALFVLVFLQESVLFRLLPTPKGGGTCAAVTRALRSPTYHLAMHVVGAGMCVGGLVTIVQYKALSPRPVGFPFYTLFSPHSWTAICFLALWLAQFVAGAVMQYAPRYRSAVTPYHHALGKVVYGLGLAVCALGLQDMQSSDLASAVPPYVDTSNFTAAELAAAGYDPDSPLARYACVMCLLLVLLALSVAFAFTARDEQKKAEARARDRDRPQSAI